MPISNSFVGPALATLIVTAGVLYYWQRKLVARRGVPMDSFGTFFLGGGRVGEYLTTNNNWGLCFAFANAMWYYAFLGYYYGVYIFLLQVAWSAAIIFISRSLGHYLSASADGTVHGFIGHRYGTHASLLAATATLIGYTLNIGFEIFYSAHLLLASLGGGQYEMVLAIATRSVCRRVLPSRRLS